MDNKAFQDDHGLMNGAGARLSDVEKPMPVVDTSHVTLSNTKEEEDDPWKVTSLDTNYEQWNELTTRGRFKRLVGYLIKITLVIGCLYMFICSLDFLSSAFRLLGGEAAGKVFQQSDIMTNPVAGLMMGVLVTVLVQSSSTSTSIVVSMVGAGILDIKTSIPIIMGANIGTSVTNTIVALGQISDKGEFRRAFAGATVHDMFNWLSVLVLLPIEIATGMLYHLSEVVVKALPLETDKTAKKDILKVITKPFTEKIIKVNKDAIIKIAKNEKADFDSDHAIMKICCDKKKPIDCCKSTIKTFDLETVSPNDTLRQAVCEEVNSCVTSPSSSPSSCTSIPWTFEAQHPETHLKLNCGAFSSNRSEITCCNNVLGQISFADPGQPTDEEKQELCSKAALSDCFTSSSTFSVQTCADNWVNRTVSVPGKDSFSCLAWTQNVVNRTCNEECEYLFKGLYPDLTDKVIGAILLVIALAILCICLVLIVKLLHSLLRGPMAVIIKKFVNADFPGVMAYFTGYLAIFIGAGLTIVVQSSSIFTSSLTPLVGIGVIELDRMYPLTLGSNIGTTTTAILSALANSGDKLRDSLQVAFCHLFFNIIGIAIYYPLPFFRPAIPMAKFLGNCTAKYRWFAIMYIFFMFFTFPALVFALSVPGWYVLLAILGPVLLLVIIIATIKVIQAKKPGILPSKLRNWKFLPLWMRSLEPYDNMMRKIFFCSRFQTHVGTQQHDDHEMRPVTTQM